MTILKTFLQKIKYIFVIDIPDEHASEFGCDLLEENFSRLSIASAALFVTELFLLLFEKHPMPKFVMVAFLLLNLVLIPLIFYIKKNFRAVRNELKLAVLYCYVLLALSLGAALALSVLRQMDVTHVYLMAVLAVSMFLYIKPVPSAILYAAVYGVFALLLPYAGARPETLPSLRVNSAIFNLFAWVFSLIALRSRASIFMSRKKLHEQNRTLEDLAQRDVMTGLYHHAASLNRLEDEICRAKTEGYPLCLIMTDIDDFKTINDTYGHQFGDDVISRVAAVFKSVVTAKGIVGRYGGEEFLIILPGSGLEEACALAERIQAVLASAISQPQVTVSGGISLYRGETLNEFVRQTDERLYHAKQSGKHRFVSTSESLRTTVFRSIPM